MTEITQETLRRISEAKILSEQIGIGCPCTEGCEDVEEDAEL